MLRQCLIALLLPVAGAAQLTSEEVRGRQIYEFGTSPSGTAIEAVIADEKVAGAILPCANCHGHDGAGKPEGGLTPSNITWEALTKPYSVTRADGRSRPAYSVHLLKRAITMGIDSGDQPLSEAMPRFHLSLADASDLTAYIKRLGEPVDPGVTATAIRSGVLLPAAAASDDPASAMRQALLEHFRRLNLAGGLFNRRIELKFGNLPLDPRQTAKVVHDFLVSEPVFAVVGDFTGAESELASMLRDTGTPAIAALAPFPQLDSSPNPFVFYLDGGVREELAALATYAGERFRRQDLRISIVASPDEKSRGEAKWLAARLSMNGRTGVPIREDPLAISGDLVFWIRPEMPSAQAAAAEHTIVLAPGSLTGERRPSTAPANPGLLVALRSLTMESRSPAEQSWYRASACAALITRRDQTGWPGTYPAHAHPNPWRVSSHLAVHGGPARVTSSLKRSNSGKSPSATKEEQLQAC